MGGFSLPHLLILAVVAILLLGGGRFSSLMGDVAKGVKNFKKGMAEEDETGKPAARIETARTDGVRATDTVVEREVTRVRDDR